ncbi:hypothetical protein LTR37_014232 [Vermiconidia calcicola]|uniref:Uncharacterized protein n=1 Tax=Vermiconidia calcicola TaxID=1690605 RepID=A0ACC3MUT0_9PEZI|nr:hypothetical protein LTR37_014232 [Vermiconidia calcicola]
MRSFAIAAGLFAVATIAKPLNIKRAEAEPCDDDAPPCMTYDQAMQVASNYGELLSDYSNAAANAYLTRNIVLESDSVNTLINEGCATGAETLGQPTTVGRADFKAGQSAQPNVPFEILNLWHTCETVIVRWRSAQEPQIVTGNIVLETKYTGNEAVPYKISHSYSEFNSGAWLVNDGVFVPTCAA